MRQIKSILLSSAAICTALSAISTPALADNEANADEKSTEVGAVEVTGSRIIRDGTSAPTPVEVVGSQEIAKQATGDVSSFLNVLPSFSGNQSVNNKGATTNISAALVGLNLANLRALGVNRTLVLVDGQRFVPTLTYGTDAYYAVDISSLPQQLIKRIEVVTGGASAVYGSDAVGGAVNFILDAVKSLVDVRF